MSSDRSFGACAATVLLALALVAVAACSGTQRPEVHTASGGDLIGETTTTAAGDPAAPGTVDPGSTGAGPGTAGPGAAPRATTAPSASRRAVPTIFQPANDHIGLTDSKLNICFHAALSLGGVLNVGADDFRVYWQMINDRGGIQGRKVDISFTDDAYTPQGGVQAAQQCKANQAFVMGGGVGFDTVPAVRAFAEQNDMLYLSSFATEADISRYQRSFSAVLSVERFGQIIGEFAAARFPGAKVGVVWRNSPNWQGGRDRFLATARARGLQIVADIPVEKDQGDYTNAILRLRDAGAQVVFGWINVLEFTQFEVQARVQDLTPTWLVAGSNLLTDTLGHDVDGTKGSQAYGFWPGAIYPPEPGASYQGEVDRMLAAYHRYRPSKDGKVGETEWQFWLASRQLHGLLDLCGRDCSRNKLAGILLDLGKTTADPLCPIDFRRGGGHLGGFALDVWKAVPDGDGSRWTTEAHCAEGF